MFKYPDKFLLLMETLDCIKKRRSCRKYLDKKVPDEVVLKLIDAARHAPFGGPLIKNCQLWEFVIVKSKETKQNLALDYDDRKFVASAPVVIAVCADKTKDKDYKDYEKTCSLAVQNILLAATDLGLGACYVSSFSHHEKHKEDKEKLRQALQLPDNIELVCLVAVGYPDSSEEIKGKELRSIGELIHMEKF